jgi:hypothetical protein
MKRRLSGGEFSDLVFFLWILQAAGFVGVLVGHRLNGEVKIRSELFVVHGRARLKRFGRVDLQDQLTILSLVKPQRGRNLIQYENFSAFR